MYSDILIGMNQCVVVMSERFDSSLILVSLSDETWVTCRTPAGALVGAVVLADGVGVASSFGVVGGAAASYDAALVGHAPVAIGQESNSWWCWWHHKRRPQTPRLRSYRRCYNPNWTTHWRFVWFDLCSLGTRVMIDEKNDLLS